MLTHQKFAKRKFEERKILFLNLDYKQVDSTN